MEMFDFELKKKKIKKKHPLVFGFAREAGGGGGELGFFGKILFLFFFLL